MGWWGGGVMGWWGGGEVGWWDGGVMGWRGGRMAGWVVLYIGQLTRWPGECGCGNRTEVKVKNGSDKKILDVKVKAIDFIWPVRFSG